MAVLASGVQVLSAFRWWPDEARLARRRQRYWGFPLHLVGGAYPPGNSFSASSPRWPSMNAN